MNTYTKPKNVYIQDVNDQFQLSKGFLHRQTITISKANSSKAFVVAFTEFIKNESISLKEGSDVDHDFEKLAQFDLVHLQLESKLKNLIVVETASVDFINKYLETTNELKQSADLLSSKDLDTLLNQKDTFAMKEIATRFSNKFEQYNLYVVLPYSELKVICSYVNKWHIFF